MTPTDDRAPEGGLVQRVEVLLSSLTAVVSARVVLDEEKGAQVHIIATSEMPVSEVSRAVMSALTWGLGFEVPSSQITVVQSHLSRNELKALLGSETADSPASAAAPEKPTTDPNPNPRFRTPDYWSSALAGRGVSRQVDRKPSFGASNSRTSSWISTPKEGSGSRYV